MNAAPAPAPSGSRLMSLDALRGFDMFWIVGAEGLVEALGKMSDNPVTRFFAYELDHAEWEGFHFEDLIFPLFVFMAGASIVFSLSKLLAAEGRNAAVLRVLRRGFLLYVVGIFYYGGFYNHWPGIRLVGVLPRIALTYTAAGLLFCYFKPRALVGICAALLLGYWAIMSFIPIRDIQLTSESVATLAEKAGDLETAIYLRTPKHANPSTVPDSPVWAATEKLYAGTTHRVTAKFGPGYNVADHFDFQHLAGKKWDGFYDPEGFFSNIPAVATCLLGVFAGLLLRNTSVPDLRKVAWLFALGIVGVCVGWLWNFNFPVIKKIWTSSYVLVAGGYSAMLLGAFYLIVDIWKQQSWCQPFVWIGTNSITIYLVWNILGGFEKVAGRFVGGDVLDFLNVHVAKGVGDLGVAVVGLLLTFMLMRFLYVRKIFLRL